MKLLDDPAYKPPPDSTDGSDKKVLRNVRLPSKNRKKTANDEPVCIALSDSEEEADDEMGDTETIDDNDGE